MSAHTQPRIQAMLKLAVSEPGMSVAERELDANLYLLGVTNGVVDLRTGLLMANEPSMYITRYCNAGYVEGAQCPRWLRFLDEVFMGDQATIQTVQRLLGYTLTGLNTEEVLAICYGFGSNGKSVFSNVILAIFGGYGMTAPSSILVARRSDDAGPRNDLAAVAGARLVSINELQAGDRLDEQVVKMLAGREPIAARFLYEDYFEFTPQFTAWLRTNHKPIITGDDDGIWRRLVLLPFKRSFKDDQKDPYLEQKLLAERAGILQWMLEGARLYLKDGLPLSPLIRAEVATYRQDSDVLGEFLADHTAVDSAERIEQSHLFRKFKWWCERNGLRVPSKKSFTQRLAERGFTEAKSGSNRYYVGLQLAEGVVLWPFD
jgi:putative DNA primase/helicase